MRRRSSGFTLVEMVVATIVLFVGGVAAMMAISSCTRSIGIAEAYSKAALLAEQRLTELETQADALTSGEQQGDFGEENAGYQWTQSVEPTDLTNVSRVTLVVTWPMGARLGTATFVTMIRTTESSE
jgi:type II secretory pathway pseudopilin PulG